ncbi:MAG TPA: molybdate ABC transporter substrate-binding protein [Thermohalobaculum sp.]|nr:molybdate ABC transporter substrate-binding protein [Thermohalobaculum sp.]
MPLLIMLTAGTATGSIAVAGPTLTVFAAASLTEAMTEAGNTFEQSQGITVQFSFASTSTLARQIEAGAPAGLVALASGDWADYLADRNLILPQTRTNAIGNQLVLIAPSTDRVTLSNPPTALDIAAALGPAGRLALGDPAHVPAGIYAQQSLENLGLWQAIEAHLAPTDNVRAALALVASGEAALGIVYATDAALSLDVQTVATLPAASHAAIAYPFAIVRENDSPQARAFLGFLTSPEGLAIFARFGFTHN